MIWPDILIAAIIAFTTLKGYKHGFVMELSGAIALALALITPWFYNGAFDGALERAGHVSAGPAHVIALFAVGIATYVGVFVLARALNIVAKRSVFGVGNALAGAAIGLIKGTIFVWIVLYVGLFFPLSRDIRADLHRSVLVGYVTWPNGLVDDRINALLPSFARPFVHPIFARHRV